MELYDAEILKLCRILSSSKVFKLLDRYQEQNKCRIQSSIKKKKIEPTESVPFYQESKSFTESPREGILVLC